MYRNRVLTCLGALLVVFMMGCPIPTTSLRIVNNSSVTIYYLRVSPSSQNEWGPDQLGSNVIRPGNTFTVTSIPCDRSYDFRLEGANHAVLAVRYGVFMTCNQTFTWTLMDAAAQALREEPDVQAATGAAKQLEVPGAEPLAKPAEALRVDEAVVANGFDFAPAPLAEPGVEDEAAPQ